MALKKKSMDKESIESIDCFITDVIGFIGKRSKNWADGTNIFDYLFNENNSVSVEKDVIKNV